MLARFARVTFLPARWHGYEFAAREQEDNHLPILTVLETFKFAFDCLTVGPVCKRWGNVCCGLACRCWSNLTAAFAGAQPELDPEASKKNAEDQLKAAKEALAYVKNHLGQGGLEIGSFKASERPACPTAGSPAHPELWRVQVKKSWRASRWQWRAVQKQGVAAELPIPIQQVARAFAGACFGDSHACQAGDLSSRCRSCRAGRCEPSRRVGVTRRGASKALQSSRARD